MSKNSTCGRFFSRYDPADKSLRVRVLHNALTAAALTLASVGLGALNLYFGAGRHTLFLLGFILRQPLLVLLNVLPFVLLTMLLWALTNRGWIAFLGAGVFTLLYSWAEYWKLMGRSDPIIAEDLGVISEGLKMGGSYITVTWQIVLSAVLVLVGTGIVFFFFRGRSAKLWPRLAAAVLILASGALLYTNVYTDAELYASFPCWDWLNEWLESDQFISRGCMYPFLYSVQWATVQPPEGYTDEKATELLESFTTDDIPEDRKVNVIMVMLEAFSDLSVCTDKITGLDPYADYHALQAESLHGQLVTNIFAAGTVNTERCVVTGFSGQTSFRRASWSYARYFADQGYEIQGSHPGETVFYNRNNVNENLGFPNYLYLENHYESLKDPYEGYVKDRVLLPELIRLSREAQSDYVFSFNATYQNHGPYPTGTLSNPNMIYVPEGELDQESWYIVNNYLRGVADTGRQLRQMASELREDEEPYVLVFFGDHKPWLGDQNSAYASLGIDLTSGTDESFFNYYSTEYLIWANDAAKERLGVDMIGEGPQIGSCYLMNVLFQACGWEGPSFLKYSEQVRAVLPVVHSTGRFLEDGRLVERKDLSPEASELQLFFRYVQYYLMRESGGKLPAKP